MPAEVKQVSLPVFSPFSHLHLQPSPLSGRLCLNFVE